MGDVNVTKVEDKEFVALADYRTAVAKVGVLENVVREYQDLVHTEKGNVERLQDEVKALEDFKKKKVEVEALKAKNEALKKNLLAVENREKARADAEIERRMAEVDADIERRVAEKVADATQEVETARQEAKKVLDDALGRLVEVEAREAAVESRINDGTATVRKTADEEKKSAQARVAAAEKAAAAEVLSRPRMEKALFALTGIVNSIDKGEKTMHPREVLKTARQIAGDALEADKKVVKDAEDAKKAAAILKAEQERLAAEEEAARQREVDTATLADIEAMVAAEGEQPDFVPEGTIIRGEQLDASKIVCVEEAGVMRFNPDAVVAAVLDPEKTSEKPEETPSEPTGEVPAV
jgi:hypothetical protein